MSHLSPATAETTYSSEYKTGTFLPPIKHHQLLSLTLKNIPKLKPRKFPIEPVGPHRLLEKEIGCSPGLGLGNHTNLPTIKYLDPKPIVRTLPPQELINEIPPKVPNKYPDLSLENLTEKPAKEVIGALSHNFEWTTAAQLLMKDVTMEATKIPPSKTTVECNADVIKYRPMRYEPASESWQRVAPVWDKIQLRHGTMGQEILSRKPDKMTSHVTKIIDVNHGIINLVKDGNLSSYYVRPCPRYAGFLPRSPVEATIEQNKVDLRTSSSQRLSYCALPREAYMTEKKFAHKGPLSRTVTLTCPFNPFNKVEGRKSYHNEIERTW
ncbi:uncharacterized protein LOC100366934 [Saccoglossus kowalevskii]|uniref:Uncharacterized protein LOC100366934 n=1 Tax=Saccoglossus kowalevskii TaxID=10224 RepID=A0ABM0GXF9_SACKO|nr:PREDICTED: uncharacterized protein LOC100366934 [Saccoglossus kowalevskii]